MMSPASVAHVANSGSPVFLTLAGRMLGLGASEVQAVKNGHFPAWFWFSVGTLAGIAAGVMLEEHYPGTLRKFVKGKK